MARLIDFLSPQHPPDIHQVSAELIKGIIALATPSPGEGLQNGPASNQFARELASKESVTKLTSYILRDFGPDRNVAPEDITDEATPTSSENEILPTFESSTSSVVHSLGVVIELIRKNNSDYFEPYLFHTLRNRLIQVQQQLHGQTDGGRDSLERAMKEMVDRMGVVHLGAVLETMCENLESLAGYLRTPRSAVSFYDRYFFLLGLIEPSEGPGRYHRRKGYSVNLREIPDMRTVRRAASLLEYGDTQPTSRV